MWQTTNFNLPKCRERQNLTALIVDAIMCIFSKFTRPSMLVLLPSWANVISFNSNGINGMTGGCNLPTDILQTVKRLSEVDDKHRRIISNGNFNLNYFYSQHAASWSATCRQAPLHCCELATIRARLSGENDKLTCKLCDCETDLSELQTRWKVFGILMEVYPTFDSAWRLLCLTFPSQWRKMHLNSGIPCS